MQAAKRIAAITGQMATGVADAKDMKSTVVAAPTGAKKAGAGTCPRAAAKKPVKVVITGAAGNIGYSIIFMVAEGQMLGADQPMHLVLLDIPQMEKSMEGLVMELQDCAYPLLTSITATSDYKKAFTDCEFALLVGARPRGPGMQRKDLLQANAAIFSGQGKALNDYAARNVKVLVVGNPANTNALIAMENAPDLPRTAFTAMTRLDQARAVSQLALRLKTPVERIKNVIIWGNHSATQYPDVNHAVVQHYPTPHHNSPVRTAVNDNDYLNGAFIKTIQERGAAIIAVRQKSSAASAAQAAVDHMRDWVRGTAVGEYVSMGVASDGSYGVPAGLIYSFPCTCSGGQYSIVKGLPIDAFSQKKMDLTTRELQEEKAQAFAPKDAAPAAAPAAAK